MSKLAREGRVLDDLRQVAGPDAYAAFLDECGGRRVYIPRIAIRSRKSRLARAFGGIEAANEVVRKINALGRCGMDVAVPLLRAGSAAKRRNAIQNALMDGTSVADIAHAFKVSERMVYLQRRALCESGLMVRRSGSPG